MAEKNRHKISFWDDSYVQYGFTKVIDCEKLGNAQCTLSNTILGNNSLKPSKLKRHKELTHKDNMDSIETFKAKRPRYDMSRVTIFLKAKIGTLVGEFSRDEIYGPFNLFFTKSGTLRCGSRLDSRSKVRDAKSERKIGVISKKKKDHHHLGCTVYVNFKPLSV